MSVFMRKGDVGTIFDFIINDENGDVVDVSTGYTVQVRFKKKNGTALALKDVTMPNGGDDGLVQYVGESGVFDTATEWTAELVITDDQNNTWTSSPYHFTVGDTLV